MKRNFKFYALIWAVLLAAFNLVVFLVRPVIPGHTISYDARFWISWSFINAAFIGNLVCAYFAFKAENRGRMFYNLSLITVSRSGLIVMLVAGCALMLIPNCPAWIAAVVCILILAFSAVAVIKAVWAADAAGRIGANVKAQTSFIKNLTVDAESVLAGAKSDAVKAECGKVYEAVRYSDPVSSDALSGIEAEITVKMNELASAVGADDAEKAKELADGLVRLIADRNSRCKRLK